MQFPNQLDSLMSSRGPAGLGTGALIQFCASPRSTFRPSLGAQTFGSPFISAQGAPCSVREGPMSPRTPVPAGVLSSFLFPAMLTPSLPVCGAPPC